MLNHVFRQKKWISHSDVVRSQINYISVYEPIDPISFVDIIGNNSNEHIDGIKLQLRTPKQIISRVVQSMTFLPRKIRFNLWKRRPKKK